MVKAPPHPRWVSPADPSLRSDRSSRAGRGVLVQESLLACLNLAFTSAGARLFPHLFSPKICWGELQLMCSQCSLFWIGGGDRDIGAGNVIRDLLRGISSVICSVVCCCLPYPDFKSLNPESPKSRFVLQKNFSPRRWPSVCHRFPRWIPTFVCSDKKNVCVLNLCFI